MAKKNSADILENATAYETYLKNSDIVRVFEIGKGLTEKSRVTEYNKNTGKELCDYSLERYGAGDEESISEVEGFLTSLLKGQKLLQKRLNHKPKRITKWKEFLRKYT